MFTTMNRYTSSKSDSIREDQQEDQEEPLYYSAFQHPEDIIYEGSDTEQTMEEVREKRQRYEESARRYMEGHIPCIQSASLRGPLNRESGWINPWRYRPSKSRDWWQPGSVDMLFTRENVMRRAAEHGLGYFTPTQALVWCKAAAETEARTELDQFDSMKAVRFEGSDVENVKGESPNAHFITSSTSSDNKEYRTKPSPANPILPSAQHTDGRNTDFTIRSFIQGTKRMAVSQWLKGSCVSKRARWEDPPISSPTPLPHQNNETVHGRYKYFVRSPDSAKENPNPITRCSAPRTHDAQQDTKSRYSGSTAQGIDPKEDGRSARRQLEDMDELQTDSQDTNSVSAPTFLSKSQEKRNEAQSVNHRIDREPNSTTFHSKFHKATKTPAARRDTLATESSGSRSNKLPTLSRSPDPRLGAEYVEDSSFATEVAPSSRDLEKFLYRKKRKKSKKHHSKEGHENPRVQTERTIRLSKSQTLADENGEVVTYGTAVESLAQKLPLEKVDAVEHEDPETTPAQTTALTYMSTLQDHIEQQQEKVSSEKASSQADESYLRKVVMLPDNLLPTFETNSPFAPFAPFDRISFNSFGASNTKLTPLSANRSVNVPDQPSLGSSPPLDTVDLSAPLVGLLENQHPARSTENHAKLVDVSFPDRDMITSRSSSWQEVDDLRKDTSSIALLEPPDRSRSTPKSVKPVKKLQRHIQETSIDDDSTQSFNSTLPKSVRKSLISLETARNVALTKIIKEEGVQVLDKSHHEVEISEAIFDNSNASLCIADMQLMESVDLSKRQAGENMDTIQHIMPQISEDPRPSNSCQTDNHPSSQPSVGASNAEPTPERTSVALDDDDKTSVADEEQESWAGCGSQSPWIAENLLPRSASKTGLLGEPYVTVARERGSDGSTPQSAAEECSDWQAVEHPSTLDNEQFKTFRGLVSPTPSPDLQVPHAERDLVSNTQLLIDAATINPWQSNSKKQASRKVKKRVSFGVLPSEVVSESQPAVSKFLRKNSRSPPPPESTGRCHDEDGFEGSPIAVGQFSNHFLAAGGLHHLLPGSPSSQTLVSPAIVAMADRFIAADRETSTDQERHVGLTESPTRHLKLRSGESTNRSPFHATNLEVEVNLDDFITDAGNFLEDWSVESEIKMSKTSKDQTEGKEATRRDLFGLRNIWAS